MVVFPNCKINLGLRILNKREDGYHNLETIFFPVPFKEALEIIPSDGKDLMQFSSSGLTVIGDIKANICVKAYHLLKKDFPQLASIKIHLHKSIPFRRDYCFHWIKALAFLECYCASMLESVLT